jgi:glycosyltransferase involved in cell wall biosynthesis
MSKTPTDITAVILTHNSSSSLESTLKSVLFCDQILVIDDFSTDQTLDIIAKNNISFHSFSTRRDFAAARNFSLTLVKTTWTLFVDSDETVPDKLAQEIITAAKTNRFDGFYLKRSDHFLGRKLNHGETNTVRLLRLGKTTAGQWLHPVHETWIIPGGKALLDTPLIHRPHPSIAGFIDKINFYTSLFAKDNHHKSQLKTYIEFFLFPVGKFIDNYFLKLGFLDGFPGLVMAFMMSLHSLIVRVKIYEQNL